MDEVGISIVNWNTGELLAQCLKSLSDLPDAERALIAEVVIVDNRSGDDSIAKAKLVAAQEAGRLRVRFVLLEENAGFARANNVAIDRIKQGQGEDCHVLLLNPDTQVRAGVLLAMLDVFKRQARAGIVGPRLKNADGSGQVSVRSFPNLYVFIFLFLKLHRLWPGSRMWKIYMKLNFDYSREQKVDQVMGAAFLIRRETLDELDGLDEDFWVWFEEVDFCRRAVKLGWETWYTPGGEIMHVGGVSFAQLSGLKKARPWIRSSLRYARKHLRKPEMFILRLLAPFALLLSIPAGLINRKG